jgi:hypothetical protein
MTTFEKDTAAWPDVDKQPQDKTTKWKVTANVAVLPKAISSGSGVSYRSGQTAIDNGLRWAISSSLGMDQVSMFTIEPAIKEDLKEDSGHPEGRLVLVENIDVTASRLLMGTIKGRYESGWRKTHGKIIEKMKEIQASKATPAV